MNLSSLLPFCIMVIASASNDYNVTEITTSSGLYYEEIGEVVLSNDKWQFFTSVDYKGYKLSYENLINQTSKIQEVCKKVKLEECNKRYDLIRDKMEKIKKNDETILLGISTARVKRSAGPTVIYGQNVSNQVIDISKCEKRLNCGECQGITILIDPERTKINMQWLNQTREDIRKEISELNVTSEKNEELRNELSKLLNETQENIKKHEKLFDFKKKIEKFDRDLKNLSNKLIDDVAKSNKSTSEYKQLMQTVSDFDFLMSQFERDQISLNRAVQSARNGNLDTYILSPLGLVRTLQEIQNNFSEHLTIPFTPNVENAYKLYNVVKLTSVSFYNNQIVYVLQIPLVRRNFYRLQKMTSLPQPLGSNKFAFILPQEPFLLIDENYQEYMFMSLTEFRDYCEEISQSQYLCKQIRQIYLADTKPQCEVVLFKTAEEVPNSCNVRITHLDRPIYLQLQRTKSWLYAVPNTDILNVDCGNTRYEKRLKGAGFIRVTGDCVLHTGHANELRSLEEFTKKVRSDYSPPADLKSVIDMAYVDGITENNAVRHPLISPFDFEELEKISVPLKKETNLNLTPLYYTLPVLIIVVFVCACAYWAYKRKTKLNRRRKLYGSKYEPRPTFAMNENTHIKNVPGTAGDVQVRLKLNKDDDTIKRISIYETESADPEAEYLTVRFKVKKPETVQNKRGVLNKEAIDLCRNYH